VFGFRGKRLRDCALMGMTAGLAAFFGVALGGSLFALEARATAGAGPHHSVAVSYARRSAGRLLV
jgi:H+/Cl- antiporter ClcA